MLSMVITGRQTDDDSRNWRRHQWI